MGTYLFPMFPVYPYLIFVGEKGTNKSGQLEFLSCVCWNSTAKLSLPNEAPLFRLMQQAKPTQLIDEVHRQLNDPIRGPILQALLETGHEQGGCVPRCDEKNNDMIKFYDTYCPKALASRESLELEEKGITIVIKKVHDNKYAIARKNLGSDIELENIRGDLFNFAIVNWEKIYTEYQKIDPTPKLSARYFVLWASILAICKVAYPDKYSEMVGYAEKAVVGAQKKSYEVEIVVLSWLMTHLEDIKSNGNAVFFKDLKDALNLKWQAIYSALRNFGLIKTDRDTKQGKKYYLHVDKIEKLAEERSIITEEKNVCDKCGEDAFTTDYNEMQVCPRCKKELEEEKEAEKLPLEEIKEEKKNNENGIRTLPNLKEKEVEKQETVVKEKPTPIEIKKIILEVGKCKECCCKDEIDLIYVVHYSNDEFKNVCNDCGEQIMHDYNLKLSGGDNTTQ